MPREKLSYMDNLERIKAAYPTKEMLNVKEVMDFTGLGRKGVLKYFTFNQYNFISVATLAREMS